MSACSGSTYEGARSGMKEVGTVGRDGLFGRTDLLK